MPGLAFSKALVSATSVVFWVPLSMIDIKLMLTLPPAVAPAEEEDPLLEEEHPATATSAVAEASRATLLRVRDMTG